jgi:hypothetical protein
MESSTQVSSSRRFVGGVVRVGLIVLAIALVGGWFGSKVSRHKPDIKVQRTQVADAALGAGDLRIYNRDSSVDIVLQGSRLLTGLSPKTVAKIQSELQRETSDTSGIGGLIASTVKGAVASNIGTHVVYSLYEIKDVRYKDGQIILERRDGSETGLFGNTKVDHKEASKTFSPEEAQKLIDAVHRRQSELHTRQF